MSDVLIGGIEKRKIVIVNYDPRWPEKFQEHAAILSRVLGSKALAIEHVGSTSVPGLAAKPVIDIMAPVRGLESSRPALAALEAVGYCYAPYKAEVEHWFCKPSPEHRTHHLHLVPLDSRVWVECLAFRDLLASDPGVANAYAALKYRLAKDYRNDRERYTEEKWPFIEKALHRAAG